jgi:Raf kinase inhibitor-like YbhB/YbcL family protein
MQRPCRRAFGLASLIAQSCVVRAEPAQPIRGGVGTSPADRVRPPARQARRRPGARHASPRGMRLTSSAFSDGGEIPVQYTCQGLDISPPLSWSDVPAQARSLALLVEDPDAPDPAAPTRVWVHWVVVDLPPGVTGLPEAVHALAHGRVGTNDWNRTRWNGPCPPIGRHRYVFRLYALDCLLELAHPSKRDLQRAMASHILAEATLTGTYQKHH